VVKKRIYRKGRKETLAHSAVKKTLALFAVNKEQLKI